MGTDMKSSANSLTGAIIDYIRKTHNHAERINNYSRTVKDKFGRDVFIPSAGFRGTSDIHACKKIAYLNDNSGNYIVKHGGLFVAIEVKVGKDTQSEAQKYYQEVVEKAGGVYMIVRSFDSFLEQWNKI
jgi:hypothetical protein